MVRRLVAGERENVRLVCANGFVNKGEGGVKDENILFVALTQRSEPGLETRARAGPYSNHFPVELSPPTINTATNCGHDSSIRTPSLCWVRERLLSLNGLAFADQNTFQAALDERTCGYGVWVRRIQYIRIASLRAAATLATVKCF